MSVRISSVESRNFKALRNYSLSLRQSNILVGPNNCGKSTIIGAFRTLAIALRRARTKKADTVTGPRGSCYGYVITKELLPISLENVHTDLVDAETTVTFRLSNGNRLVLYFPIDGGCRLIAEPAGRPVSTPTAFKHAFPLTISTVPVLGPVEHEEPLVQRETVERGLGTHRASRHFRNYWWYFPDGFEEFAKLVADTWPGMEIQRPEKVSWDSNTLSMFCTEDRMARELYWAGFGFQVWCQLLTHIASSKEATILIIDEPEIYLHPDVQRQFLSIARDAGPDVVLATHSTEMIAEADPTENG